MSAITLPTTTASRATGAAAAPPRVGVAPVDTSADRAAWAAYVQRAPGATLCHDPAWCWAVEQCFGHAPRHLLARRGPQVVGVLPLVEVDSLFGGRLHVSVPYGTYGGIVADDEPALAALAQAALAQAEARAVRVLDLRSAQAVLPGLEPAPGYVGFTRPLPERDADVAAFLPKRARAAARHARDRDGVTVVHDRGQLRTVWELYCRSMRRIASINYPYAFFEALCAGFGARAWVSVAWQGRRPVAGTLSLVFRDTIMPYVLGADERVRCDGAANLLYWSVMECAVRAGVRVFDYGRSRADNAGAVGFKKNQGFEPQPLGYQRYVPGPLPAPDLRPTNPRFALARRVWRRLPLPATRFLGSRLARWLPG
jgi:FemAB-related protein (PEP-CTERM system-associated)